MATYKTKAEQEADIKRAKGRWNANELNRIKSHNPDPYGESTDLARTRSEAASIWSNGKPLKEASGKHASSVGRLPSGGGKPSTRGGKQPVQKSGQLAPVRRRNRNRRPSARAKARRSTEMTDDKSETTRSARNSTYTKAEKLKENLQKAEGKERQTTVHQPSPKRTSKHVRFASLEKTDSEDTVEEDDDGDTIIVKPRRQVKSRQRVPKAASNKGKYPVKERSGKKKPLKGYRTTEQQKNGDSEQEEDPEWEAVEEEPIPVHAPRARSKRKRDTSPPSSKSDNDKANPIPRRVASPRKPKARMPHYKQKPQDPHPTIPAPTGPKLEPVGTLNDIPEGHFALAGTQRFLNAVRSVTYQNWYTKRGALKNNEDWAEIFRTGRVGEYGLE